jgi:hypothetical protein
VGSLYPIRTPIPSSSSSFDRSLNPALRTFAVAFSRASSAANTGVLKLSRSKGLQLG